MEISYILAFLFLLSCSIFDFKRKQIPVVIIIIFGVVSCLFVFTEESINWESLCADITPGIILLLISYATKQEIGYGDGLVVLLLGLLLGIKLCVAIVFIGLLLSSIVSIIKIVAFKANKHTRIPYVPFLLTAWGVLMIGI